MFVLKFFCLLASLAEILSLFWDYSYVPHWQYWIISAGILFLGKPKKLDFDKECFKWVAVLSASITLRLTVLWAIDTFPLDDPEQVLITLSMPLDGFVLYFLKQYLVRVILVSVVLSLCLSCYFKNSFEKRFTKAAFSFIALAIGWNAVTIFGEIPLGEYRKLIENNRTEVMHNDAFMTSYYTPLSADSVKDSNGSRNLILIIAESMESSFMSDASEIARLRDSAYSFAKDSLSYGGGDDIVGSVNTMGATISKTTGFPLLNVTYSMHRNFDGVFFPRITSIYDVLKSKGYHNTQLQGTAADFSLFRKYLNDHGVSDIYDTKNLLASDLLKDHLYDQDVFDVAKLILDTLSKKEHFSLTIATIDTHFPYGMLNPDCGVRPSDNSDYEHFRASLKCSSISLGEFISWMKQQPYYANTEIVLVGDHMFMGGNILKSSLQRKWINFFINTSKSPQNLYKRTFASVDIAPSILESMGFELQNHRMGFGVSLFSSEKTLLEELGIDSVNSAFRRIKYSVEYNQLMMPLDME